MTKEAQRVMNRTKEERVYIGSYNAMSWSRGEKGEGLYHAVLDAESGQLRVDGCTGGLVNPSFSAFSRDGRYLYTINEVQPLDESAIGRVTSFAVDSASGALEKIGECSSYGLSPCYLVLDEARACAYLSNYCGPSAVAIELRGHVLGDMLDRVVHTGSGPDAERQEAAHPHSVALDRSGRHLLVADLGTDQVYAYRIEESKNGVALRWVACGRAPAGSGPRHMLFDESGENLYVTCEMGSMVCRFRYDEVTGGMELRQKAPTVPGGAPRGNCCAHLAMACGGRYLYASNRGHDSIAMFAVEADGALALLGTVPSGGETPRNFAVDPSGQWLVAANQDSNAVSVFAIDAKTGLLHMHSQIHVPAPVHVAFAPVG